MIFTQIHQLFLYDHGSSVFAGNKATSFKSRSLGFGLGEDVRIGAVVHLSGISLGIWKQQWGQNLPLPLCLPGFKCDRPVLLEKQHCVDKGSFSGWVRVPLIVWDVNMGTLSPLPSEATGCLHVDYPAAVWQLPTTPSLAWVHSAPSKLFFIHILEYIFWHFSEYCFKTKGEIFSSFKSLSNFVSEVISYCSYFVVTVVHTDF